MRKIFLSLLLMALPASAASLTIQLDPASLFVLPGETVTFKGAITNLLPAAVDLNAISVNLTGDFTVDSQPFFFGPLSVSGQETTLVFDFFAVTPSNPFSPPFGSYAGTISLLGGVQVNGQYDPGVFDLLGEATFSVEVIDPSSAAIPEPATGALFLLGALACGLRRHLHASH